MVNSFPLTMKLISSQVDLLQITFSASPQSLWIQLNERNFHLFSSCTLLDCGPLCPFPGLERVNTFHAGTVSDHLMVMKDTNRTHKKTQPLFLLWHEILKHSVFSFLYFWELNREVTFNFTLNLLLFFFLSYSQKIPRDFGRRVILTT